jgi:hypothetical protein
MFAPLSRKKLNCLTQFPVGPKYDALGPGPIVTPNSSKF